VKFNSRIFSPIDYGFDFYAFSAEQHRVVAGRELFGTQRALGGGPNRDERQKGCQPTAAADSEIIPAMHCLPPGTHSTSSGHGVSVDKTLYWYRASLE
jgi:hypothetical protein